jgi:hypothetical protein
MRLLNTTTIELKYFIGDDIPPYAILSHTWDDEEVTFKDMSDRTAEGKRLVEATAGFRKISRCCSIALADGFEWVWIDTCCIDKASSAELSEAINSMYMWYSKADVCYVYLSDVDEASHWKHSRWFTRGWTLQELIAPSSVIFFDRDWEEVGTKLSLHKAISGVTRIPSEALLGECRLTYCSVAQRMSWAARRKTTRSEDLAYCLLGLFRVSMPLLYGEGLEKAFVRLQIEILRNEVDTSMFAWESNSGCATLYATGLLATSPSAFYNSGDVRGLSVFMSADYPSITVTPRGVNLRTEIMGSVPAIASVGTRRSDGKVLSIGVQLEMYARWNSDIRVYKEWDSRGADGAAIDKVWRGYRVRDSKLVVWKKTSSDYSPPVLSDIPIVSVQQGFTEQFPLPGVYDRTSYTIKGFDADGGDLNNGHLP